MDKPTFEDCFKSWLDYKPFKKRDWPDLKETYFNNLSRESPALLKEALFNLFSKTDEFPTIKLIKSELAWMASQKTENGVEKLDHREEWNTATRLMENHLGMPIDAQPRVKQQIHDIAKQAAEYAQQKAEEELQGATESYRTYMIPRFGMSYLTTHLREVL